MLRVEEKYWHCLNPDCGRSAVSREEDGDGKPYTCICGTTMRREAQPAVFSYLDFLAEERETEPAERAVKEQEACER